MCKEPIKIEEAEFDKFADEYSELHAINIAITGEKPKYFAEYKVMDFAMEYKRANSTSTQPRILDFGAGVGNSIPFFRHHLPQAKITCLDVSRKSLKIGASKYSNDAEFRHFDGKKIPYPKDYFDGVIASCVFHHIPHSLHVGLIKEIYRILKNNGLMCIFEHNPYNPLTLHAVNTCPFDENAKLLSAQYLRQCVKSANFAKLNAHYRLFFPKFLNFLRPLEKKLTWLPIGAQYYVVARK